MTNIFQSVEQVALIFLSVQVVRARRETRRSERRERVFVRNFCTAPLLPERLGEAMEQVFL